MTARARRRPAVSSTSLPTASAVRRIDLPAASKRRSTQAITEFRGAGHALRGGDAQDGLVFPERLADFHILAFDGTLDAIDIRISGDAETHEQIVLETDEEAGRPGSPWRPARPRSWWSIRRAS